MSMGSTPNVLEARNLNALGMPAKSKDGEPKAKDPAAIAIGAQIRLFRDRAGLTQKEVARRSGYDSGSISRLEKGEIVAKISTLAQIAGAIGVSVSALTATLPAVGGGTESLDEAVALNTVAGGVVSQELGDLAQRVESLERWRATQQPPEHKAAG